MILFSLNPILSTAVPRGVPETEFITSFISAMQKSVVMLPPDVPHIGIYLAFAMHLVFSNMKFREILWIHTHRNTSRLSFEKKGVIR